MIFTLATFVSHKFFDFAVLGFSGFILFVRLKMVSDASKKKAAAKKAAAAAKRGGKAAAAASSKTAAAAAADVQNGVEKMADMKISDRTCTGVLCSHPLSRDIRVCCDPIAFIFMLFLLDL